MIEIIKEGHYEKTALCFRCDQCGTEFRTDEYLIMHAPRTVGQNKPSEERYFHATCPLCKHFITHIAKF